MRYLFCGKLVTVKDNNVYLGNNWIGNLFVDDYGIKHVLGPLNKGVLNPIEIEYSITILGTTYEPHITDIKGCTDCDLYNDDEKAHPFYCGNICTTFECALNVSNVVMRKLI